LTKAAIAEDVDSVIITKPTMWMPSVQVTNALKMQPQPTDKLIAECTTDYHSSIQYNAEYYTLAIYEMCYINVLSE